MGLKDFKWGYETVVMPNGRSMAQYQLGHVMSDTALLKVTDILKQAQDIIKSP